MKFLKNFAIVILTVHVFFFTMASEFMQDAGEVNISVLMGIVAKICFGLILLIIILPIYLKSERKDAETSKSNISPQELYRRTYKK